SGHLEKTESGETHDHGTGLVFLEFAAQTGYDLLPVFIGLHIYKIDYHDTTDISQPELSGNFRRRFQVGVQRGLRDIASREVPGRVYIYDCHGLGSVDIDISAAGESNRSGIENLELLVDVLRGESVSFDVSDYRFKSGLELAYSGHNLVP